MNELRHPFLTIGEHFAIDLPGARAVFTTRRGGVSTGPYASLNLGANTDDDPVALAVNHQRIAAQCGVAPVHGRQVHGDRVAVAGPEARGPQDDPADGRATNASGIAPMVLTADCLAIAIAAPGAVAVVHAGWRGLAGGVVAAGAGRVRELGGRGPMGAAIGPGAGPCCYEVGEEVRAAFAACGGSARRGRNLDLPAIARLKLRAAGVDVVHDIEMCTICGDPDLFFSHRRDHGVTGRQAGLAWLT